MKIIVLQPDSEMYGACRSLLRTILAMGSRRPTVVAVFPYDGPAIEAYSKAGIETSIEPDLAVMRRQSKGFSGMLKLARAYRRSGSRVAKRHTDASLVHSNSMTVLSGMRVSRQLSIPHVWQVREAPQDGGFLLRVFQLLAGRSATRVAVISNAAQELIPRGTPTYLTPNGYSRGGRPVNKRFNHAQMGRIGIAARILPTKGHEVLLDAWKQLPTNCAKNLTLHIAGTTYPGHEQYAEHILSRLENEVGPEHFAILGWQDPIEPFLDEIDILVVATTHGEGFSTISLEALAAGVPVIAAAEGGITELVDDTCGRAIRSDDPAALAGAISELVALTDEDANRMRAHALERARKWSPENSADALLQCWSNALLCVQQPRPGQ